MFKLPDFPSIDFSQLDLNALRESQLVKRLAAIDTDAATAALRDAVYLTVGLGVVAVEGAQARSRKLAAAADVRVDAVEARLEAVIDRLEGVLPEQAGHLVGQARDITRVARKQVRGLVRNAA